MSWQKARDGILVVTMFGALAMLPPILPFFDRPVDVLGMPLIVVYVFGAWAALIVLTWWLSRRLPHHVDRETTPGAAGHDPPADERAD